MHVSIQGNVSTSNVSGMPVLLLVINHIFHKPYYLTLLKEINVLGMIYPLACLSFPHLDLLDSFILVCIRIKYTPC